MDESEFIAMRNQQKAAQIWVLAHAINLCERYYRHEFNHLVDNQGKALKVYVQDENSSKPSWFTLKGAIIYAALHDYRIAHNQHHFHVGLSGFDVLYYVEKILQKQFNSNEPIEKLQLRLNEYEAQDVLRTAANLLRAN